MTAQPFLLQMPDPDQCPARNLIGGYDTLVIYANSAADATAIAQGLYGTVWGSALVTPMSFSGPANNSMAGWRFRITLYNAASPPALVTDISVVAPGTGAKATGSVNLTAGQPDANDQFTIGGVTYTFVSAIGSSSGNVLIGASAAATIANLVAAINFASGEGTTYIGTSANPEVSAVVDGTTDTVADITALLPGTEGNSIGLAATTNVSTNLAVSGSDLSGGTGTTPSVSGLAEAMVAALNDAGIGISNAAYNTGSHVLTVAGTADNIGNYTFTAGFYPPPLGFSAAQNADSPNNTDDTEADVWQDQYSNEAGVFPALGYPVPGFVGTITDGGSAGSALTVALVADTYQTPVVNVAARAQQ